MNILEQIIEHKKAEVAQAKQTTPLAQLERSTFFNRIPFSVKAALSRADASGVIAEIKRRSPSKGSINPNIVAAKLAQQYYQAGASAVSILTDQHYFGGSSFDLSSSRELVNCPILRKDFIVDPYQIFEAKSIGADFILLIAAALSPEQIESYSTIAHGLGLEVLLEVHDLQELQTHLNPQVDVVGVNNRSLKTFAVNVATSLELAKEIPQNFLKISESGLAEIETIASLKAAGYRGFLIGETFTKTADPGKTCAAFIQSIKGI